MSYFTRFLIVFLPGFWLLGLLIPALYLLYLKNIKRPISLLYNRDPYSWWIVIFFFLQIISVAFSVFEDYFTSVRLLAIVHNMLAFTFVILGYAFAVNVAIREQIVKDIKVLFLFLTISSILVFVFSMLSNSYLSYPGLLAFATEADNPFTYVIFNQQGWIANIEFARSRVMAVFPNGSAILILVVYLILISNNNVSKRNHFYFDLLFVAATFTTGSRNGILISIFIFLIQFINTKGKLLFLVLIIPIIFSLMIYLIKTASDLRQDSNDTRLELYWDSIIYSYEHNPILGLGLKPKVQGIANGELPIGSHSTLLGYFIKNGILGGTCALFFYCYLIYISFKRLGELIFTKKVYYKTAFTINIGMVLILTSLLFDDFDSLEIVPFYFGILLFIFKNNES